MRGRAMSETYRKCARGKRELQRGVNRDTGGPLLAELLCLASVHLPKVGCKCCTPYRTCS